MRKAKGKKAKGKKQKANLCERLCVLVSLRLRKQNANQYIEPLEPFELSAKDSAFSFLCG